ncbi:T cell receptor beta variable 19 [Camelus dromedarius]|nr:T cell receptor beta variable 19 [Camelus dromedarius]
MPTRENKKRNSQIDQQRLTLKFISVSPTRIQYNSTLDVQTLTPALSSHHIAGLPSGRYPQPLYLYRTGPTDAEIYQRRFLLAGAGRDVTLECEQSLRYNAMYWYPQDPELGLRLIYYSTVEKDVQRGDISEGYSVSREEKGLFPLTVKLAHINQTALYVCSGSAPRWNTATAHRCTNPLQPCGPHYSLYLKCSVDASVPQTPGHLV